MGSRRESARWAGRPLSLALALTAVLAVGPLTADAATVSNAWRAKIGSSGVNGTATIQAYTTGTGSIVLKLAKLKASTLVPVTLYKGTCSSVGTVLIKSAAIKTTSAGAAARTTSLTTSQVNAIKAATKGTGKIAIRVGSSSTGGVKCGLFAVLAVPPYVAAQVTVGKSPSGVAIAPNGIWVTNWFDNTLSRIDSTTNAVLQTLPVTIAGTGGPEAIAYGEGSLWVTVSDFDSNGNALAGSLLRLDPATGQQLATIAVGKGPFDVEVAPGAVWVPSLDDNMVARIDPATNAVTTTIPVPGNPTGVAFGLGSVWVSSDDGRVTRIDPATNQVTATIQTQDTGGYVAVGGNAVWVTNAGQKDAANGMVTRIDPATNQIVASVAVGPVPQEIAYGGGSLWVGLFDTPTVVRVSASTNAILNRVSVAHSVYSIAATDHAVWVVHNLAAPDANSDVPAGLVSRITY